MNDLILTLFQFEKTEIRVLSDASGEPLFVAKDVAAALGYADTNNAIKQHCRGVVEYHPIVDSLGRKQEARVIREPDLYRLIAGSQLPSAQSFERLVFEDILPSIRKTGRYEAPNAPAAPLDKKLVIGRAAVDWLRMSDTSKLRLLADISKSEGVDPSFLPSYVDESLTRSMTELLNEHGKPFSIHVANATLEAMGLLETLTRPSSKGQSKPFKSLTAAGLEYGRNETSPQNPRETQPLYFVHRFPELLDRINAHRATHQGDSNVTPIRPEGAA
jgi:prophage antirepressor-like protein